jgi:hypothetical protein
MELKSRQVTVTVDASDVDLRVARKGCVGLESKRLRVDADRRVDVEDGAVCRARADPKCARELVSDSRAEDDAEPSGSRKQVLPRRKG